MSDDQDVFWCNVCDQEYTVDELKKSTCPVCGRSVAVVLRAADDFDKPKKPEKPKQREDHDE